MYKLSEQEIENAPEFMHIEGYEGLYEVGKNGSVWSLNYHRTGQRKQLRAAPDKAGYLGVKLYKDGQPKQRLVHQLVLNAYLSKPSPELEVLHLNSKPTDNRLENLAWGTHEENNNDSHRTTLISEVMTNRPDQSTPVLCIETGTVYPSTQEAERQTGVNQGNISSCCNGKRQMAGGYHWQKFIE